MNSSGGEAIIIIDKEEQRRLRQLEENKDVFQIAKKFLAGGIATAFTSAIFNGPDHVKTRMQITQSKQGFLTMFKEVYKQDGIMVLLGRGLFIAIVREFFYSSTRMGLYDPLKSLISREYFLTEEEKKKRKNIEIGLGTKILSGAISGSLGSIVSNACDIVKIRQQGTLQKNTRANYWFEIVYDILRKEGQGFMGLFRGATPNVARASVLTATQLSTYDHTKHLLLKTPYFSDNVFTHMSASLVAGLMTTITTNPFDVIKTRYMNSKGNEFNGVFDCTMKTFKEHGLKGFKQGFLPNYLRISGHCLMTLPLYEEIRKLFGLTSV
ncbi:hypothetical protein ABK040_001875 [Willaertia magna]